MPSPNISMKRILIAASGTGGHLFPARFIAEEISRQNADVSIEFIGSGRPLEAQIIDAYGYKRHEISLVGLKNKGIIGICKFLSKLPLAFIKTLHLLRTFKPDVIVGVGGYVSVLPVVVGYLLGIPAWIHEAEKEPGWANQLLSFFAKRASLAHAETKFKGSIAKEFCGHPVHPEIITLGERRRRELTTAEVSPVLLVLGGSQGASSLDKMVESCIPVLKQKGFSVIHQARSENCESLQQAYDAAGIQARVLPFIQNMAAVYAEADVIIARSGAGTVREVSVINTPAIFVPLNLGAHNEQFHNADKLASVGKAFVVEQGNQEKLVSVLTEIAQPQVRMKMMTAAYSLQDLNAAQKIAAGILTLSS